MRNEEVFPYEAEIMSHTEIYHAEESHFLLLGRQLHLDSYNTPLSEVVQKDLAGAKVLAQSKGNTKPCVLLWRQKMLQRRTEKTQRCSWGQQKALASSCTAQLCTSHATPGLPVACSVGELFGKCLAHLGLMVLQ